jgi:Leucine-rich repeat (LRR) protein
MIGGSDIVLSPMTSSPSKTNNSIMASTASFNDLPPLPMAYEEGTFHHERDIARPADDFTDQVHDQLPSIESYKTNVSHTTTKFDTSRRTYVRKIILIVAGTFVFVSVCITLGVMIGRDEVHSEQHPSNTAQYKPSYPDDGYDEATSAPIPLTSAPIPINNINPNATLTVGRTPSRVENVKAFVSTNGWSDLESTDDPESPQYKASLWLADFDALNIKLEYTDEVLNRYVLAVLYYALNGPHWTYDLNWMTIHKTCLWNVEWKGLSNNNIQVGTDCDEELTVIHTIYLPSMGLKGKLPTEIGLLSGLQVLDLYNNDLIGTVPTTIGKLPGLTDLVLHDNYLTGPIPSWLSEVTTLTSIDLSGNNFHGGLPTTFKSLSKLTSLNLEDNSLVNGTLDPLSNLNSIKYLRLGNNNLTGDLSADLLLEWSRIVELDLSGNKLNGNLPDNLFEMQYLRIVDLHSNKFDGVLPPMFGYTPVIEFLSLSQNRLSGSIDSSISSLSNLRHLDLSWNLLDGTIPTEIGSLYSLKYLFLSFNPKLTAGTIPKGWDSLSELVDLSLQATNRNGTIPGEIGLLTNLVMLDLAGNKLTGAIPDDLGDLSKLSFLILKDNHLIGEIPTALNKLSQLNTIVIDHNNLSGGAANLCSPKLDALEVFISDCKEVGCETSCCTKCCADGVSCNNIRWFSRKLQ